MGEIADDCYTQGLSDYWDLSDEDRADADDRMWASERHMREQYRLRAERAAELRGKSRRLPHPDDPAPF